MDDLLGMRVIQRIGHPGDDRQRHRQGQQRRWLGVRHQVAALEELHRNVGQILLFAGIVHRDDIGMIQAPGGFRLAEETQLHIGQFVFIEFLGQRHGLDRDDTVDLWITPLIHHAHGAFAQFLLDLVTAQHRLLQHRIIEHQGAGRTLTTPARQHDGFGHLPGDLEARRQIAEFRIETDQILKNRFGLVELTLALIVEGEVVHVLHQPLVHRAFAKLVECQIELPLPLKRERQHAVRFARFKIRFFLAPLGHQKALGGQQQMADHQQ